MATDTADVALRAPWCRWTLLLAAGAFVVRLAVVLGTTHIVLVNDSADYQRLAASLVAGHGFGTSHFAPGGGPTALRPPLWPLVLSGIYEVTGVHLTGARVVECLLGALTVALLVYLTWILWGRTVALVAGALDAVFPPQIMATTSPMSEVVALPLELACLVFAVVFRRTGLKRWALCCGVSLGLLVLTRPSLAVLTIALVTLMCAVPWRRALLAGLVVVVAGTAVVTPWLVRDRLTFHQWIPITTQEGYVLSGTYNQTSAHDHKALGAWRPATFDPSDLALIEAHPHAQEPQLDSLLTNAALHYAGAHPSYVATVFAENTLRLFDLAPVNETRAATLSEYDLGGIWGWLEVVSGPLILLLALVGVVLRRGRQVPAAYLIAPLLLWVSTVVLQAVPRFRAVIDPFLIQLAAVALVEAVRRRRREAPAS
ncbi:MAG: ArnT family glycosyltransferase [Acidimicrobiales bacterium]